MNYEIRYISNSGNTKKVADAMADELGIASKSLSAPFNNQIDILFLGGGIYRGNVNKKLQAFMKNLTQKQVKEVVVFTTAGGSKSAVAQFKSVLEPKGIDVSDEFFHCNGQFLWKNRKRPNQEDLKNAAIFARKKIEQ